MAVKTDTPKVHQHLLSDDERRKWKVIDTAVVSPTSVTALLQNDQEWCIDTFDYDENEFQRGKRICLQTNWKEPPLLLSYLHIEKKLKHFICTKTELHLVDDESESIEKSVPLSAEPSALCVEDNNVYISTNKSTTLMFFKLDLPTDTSKIYLKEISEHDSIAEFVVHSKNIFVCTKGGKVSSHKETGGKQHDYRNKKSKNSKARGLAVFTPQGKGCNLLLVTWNDNTLFIYSTITSHDLLNITLNVPGKFKFTTSCFLMSSEVNNVAVYKMKAFADRGTFKMILVSGSRDGELSYLHDFVLNATTTAVPVSRNFFIKREKLKTLVQMYDHSCNTREQFEAEKKKASIESDHLRRMNEEKEEKCCSLTKQLETERKTTEELKHDIDRSKKEKEDVTEKLENTISNLSRKEVELSDVKAKLDTAENAREKLEHTKALLEKKNEYLTKLIAAEERNGKELKESLSKAEIAREALEQTKALLEKEKENLTKLIAAEERNGKELKESLSKAETSRKSLEETKSTIEKEKEDLTKQLATEERIGREVKESLSKAEIAREALEQTTALLEKEKEDLSKLLAAEERKGKELKQSLSKMIKQRTERSDFASSVSEERLMRELAKPRSGSANSLSSYDSKERVLRRQIPPRSGSASSVPPYPWERVLRRQIPPRSGFASSVPPYPWERMLRRQIPPRSGSANSLSSYDSEGRLTRGYTSPRSGSANSLSSYDSGIGSRESILALPEEVPVHKVLDTQKYRHAVNLMSTIKITKDGGLIEIKGTDVFLLIPPGALLEDCKIHIQIITGNLDTGDDVTFASNSATIVELTPNNLEFQTAVELQLPHCLQLKENFTTESVEIFASHHHPKASPHWERDTEVKFELQEESCKLYLKKFCWVTFRINNEIVEAKRLKIFTFGSKVIDTDNESTVNVGYFADVPGNEDIFIDKNITVGQYKPFWFKKEEPTPLVIFLQHLTPYEWKNTADESRKDISYQDIASSKNRSCKFVLRCTTSVKESGVPYATFRVNRQHDSTNISFRPKIWDEFSEDEES